MEKKLILVISEKGKDIDTIIRKTSTEPLLLYKSLQEFRQVANDALTKLVEDSGDTEEYIEEDVSSGSDEDAVCSNPKRRKEKLKM